MKKILIIGATSAIAEECSKKLIKSTESIFLFGRNKAKLDIIINDLKVRGVSKVGCNTFDAKKHCSQAQSMIDEADDFLGGIDTIILSHGLLLDQNKCEKSINKSKNLFTINLLSMISYLIATSEYLIKKDNGGKIVVISSVAGDRARISNYAYGTTKNALSFYCDGLGQRLSKYNINILIVKPGFVDTPMTAHIPNKGFLWSTPEKVAKDIIRNINKKKKVLYTPKFWFFIMMLVKLIPKRLLIKFKI